MIPYEELVIALQTWRAKQGLPIAQMSGMIAPPPAAPVAAPRTHPPSAPNRTSPPVAPPQPMHAHDEALDVDEAALLEESAYENEGDDFAMSFADKAAAAAAAEHEHEEATAIGGAPKPGESFGGTDPTGGRGRGRNEDW